MSLVSSRAELEYNYYYATSNQDYLENIITILVWCATSSVLTWRGHAVVGLKFTVRPCKLSRTPTFEACMSIRVLDTCTTVLTGVGPAVIHIPLTTFANETTRTGTSVALDNAVVKETGAAMETGVREAGIYISVTVPACVWVWTLTDVHVADVNAGAVVVTWVAMAIINMDITHISCHAWGALATGTQYLNVINSYIHIISSISNDGRKI